MSRLDQDEEEDVRQCHLQSGISRVLNKKPDRRRGDWRGMLRASQCQHVEDVPLHKVPEGSLSPPQLPQPALLRPAAAALAAEAAAEAAAEEAAGKLRPRGRG